MDLQQKLDEITDKEKRKQKRLQDQLNALSKIPNPQSVQVLGNQNNNQNQNIVNPQNMLRIVRVAQPTLMRNKLVSVQPMSPVTNSIQYIKPFFSDEEKVNLPKYLGNNKYKVKDKPFNNFNKIWARQVFMNQQKTDSV